ncbi:MAG: response regulator [Pseudobdellovibrionaceae bacterium]
MKIIFVDNEPTMKLALDLMFKGHSDFKIFFAQSKEEALKTIVGNEIEILVCDYNLDPIKGIELITEAKKIFPDLKTIVMTGESVETVRPYCEEVGVDLILEKSSQFNKFLISELKKLLEV